MTTLIQDICSIRDLINSPRKLNLLICDKGFWQQICSSLDIIEDTELAIEEYLKLKNGNDGLNYLYIFGILQVLYVQQDAVKNLGEGLKIPIEWDEILQKIRNFRNDSIGHPTKRDKNKKRKFNSYNFIVRGYLSHQSITLMTTYPALSAMPEFTHHNIPSLIKLQRSSIDYFLKEVLQKLKDEEREHKMKYKEDKLSDCFLPTLDYHFQKLYAAASKSILLHEAKFNFREVSDILNDFKKKLTERGIINSHEGMKFVLSNLDYPMKKLSECFNDNIELDKEQITIYTFYIQKQFKELIEMALGLDEEYTSDK